MGSFDRRNRKLAKKLKVSERYRKRVEETLIGLPLEKEGFIKKRLRQRRMMQLMICLVMIVCIGVVCVSSTDADVFGTFKKSLLNYFQSEEGKEPEKLGVKSRKENEGKRPELKLELCESVIDYNNIYLLVKISAPATVDIDSQSGFDYFAFSYGESFDTQQLLGGVRDCRFFEMSEGENAATFVVSLSCEEQIEEGKPLSVTFQNFMRDPYGENAEMLAEGEWSLTFTAEYTVTDQILVEGTEEMSYVFLGEEAVVRSIVITPLGMEVSSEITAQSYENAAVMDSRSDICLKLFDGSEVKLMSHDLEEEIPQIASSSIEFSEDTDVLSMTNKFEFSGVLDLQKIAAVTVEDLMIPVCRK